jgi:exosortase/archaeosortase family protein
MFARLAAILRANWLGIRVIATFIFLITVFFMVLTWKPIVRHVDLGAGLAYLAAWMSYGILLPLGKIAGFDVHIMGTILASNGFEVDVAPACSGAVPTSIYLSAVLAYPTSWRAKAIGTGLGIGVIHMVNLLRVSALFLIGLYMKQIFHETHVYVAQALVVCVAVALWLYWATRFADAPATS